MRIKNVFVKAGNRQGTGRSVEIWTYLVPAKPDLKNMYRYLMAGEYMRKFYFSAYISVLRASYELLSLNYSILLYRGFAGSTDGRTLASRLSVSRL